MAAGEDWVQPISNVSDLIWAGQWEGAEVIPFPPMALILLGVGLWIMIGLRFYPIVKLASAARGLFKSRKSSGAGEISPFAALSTALSGQVGTGNLAGVATAIALGGPGAIFWMWVTACSAWRSPSLKAASRSATAKRPPTGSIAAAR